MITKEEIEIFKSLLINKSLDEVSEFIGFEYNVKLNKPSKLDEGVWLEIKDGIINSYKTNIQKPEFNKLRKKVELKNAKLGFLVPQKKLVAKEKLTHKVKSNFNSNKSRKKSKHLSRPKPKKTRKEKKLSKSKIEKREKEFKISIYLYFQSINYDKDIYELYKLKNNFKDIKDYLKELFNEHDKVVCKKIEIAENFYSLFFTLPKDKSLTKNICKLVEFEKKTNKKRFFDKSKSVRTISIPMGGQNK
ncbi:MAG: hypothetical protein ABF242_00100 [Flavobacteriales bacterium]